MRKLNEKDLEIFRKLAPEASIPTHYRSILPPVSMHFAADDEDLQDRLKRLSTEDLKYLADLILDGSECLLCISPEAAGMFLDLLEEGPRRALLDDVISDVNLLLAHYMRALFLLSAAAFATYAIFFSVMRMPYAILLAAVGGLLEFIPMLGPVTAIALILIVASLAGVNLVPIVVFVVLFRVVQDYVVSPHLMGRGVQLHPLLVLFGVFAGAEIAGIQGTFLSVPVLAMVRIVYLRIRKARLSARQATA